MCCCSTDLLRAALNVMMPIAIDYPHAFAGHFRVSYINFNKIIEDGDFPFSVFFLLFS